jgi:hypothetical protein
VLTLFSVSTLLNDLDMVAVFLRAELDRILAMTDLAGISKLREIQASSKVVSVSSKRPRFHVSALSPRRSKRQVSYNPLIDLNP